MTRPLTYLFPLFAVCLVLTGCLRIQQEIEIQEKNTGAFKIQVSLPIKVYKEFVVGQGGQTEAYFDPEKGAAYFAEKDGFQISKYRIFDHEDRKYIQIEGKMTDLKKALASGKLGNFEMKTVEKSTTLRLKWNLPADAAPKHKISKAAAGLKMFLKIKVPGKITETTSPQKERKEASWTFNADADRKFLEHPPKIEVTYKN